MTILAIVNADKEGQIESKMMKSRQMEEIREARRKEAEVRQEQKKSKLVRYSLFISCCHGSANSVTRKRLKTQYDEKGSEDMHLMLLKNR